MYIGSALSVRHLLHTEGGGRTRLSPLFRYNKVENFDGLSGCRTFSPRRYFN